MVDDVPNKAKADKVCIVFHSTKDGKETECNNGGESDLYGYQ